MLVKQMICSDDCRNDNHLHEIKSDQLKIFCCNIQNKKGIKMKKKQQCSLYMVNMFLFFFLSLEFKHMKALKCINKEQKDHQIF